MKIKRILISQPKPELERSPYFDIARNYGLEIDFRPFIQVEGIPSKEFRKNRVDILSYTAVIMTSKNAVDHFFRVCAEMRIIVPETMKYFCTSERVAYYLQKYIQYRKRKIFSSNFSFSGLVEIIKKKHKGDKFLLPCTDTSNEEYTDVLDKGGIKYAKAPLYRAVFCNLTDINFADYDMVVLFSSAGITSLLTSYPNFKQNNIMIAVFGEQTAKAAIDAGLKLHIHAPQPQATSMATALDLFLKGELKYDPENPNWLRAPSKPEKKSTSAKISKAKKRVVTKKKHETEPPKKVAKPETTKIQDHAKEKKVKSKPLAKPAKKPIKHKAKSKPLAKPAKKPTKHKAKSKPSAKPAKKKTTKPKAGEKRKASSKKSKRKR